MNSGCCSDTQIRSHVEVININGHDYKVTIVYCSSCGSLKALSNIRHEK
jgi:hypothetical protein